MPKLNYWAFAAIGTFWFKVVQISILIVILYIVQDKAVCLDKTPTTHWTESTGISINSTALVVTTEDCDVQFVESFDAVSPGHKTLLWYPTGSSCDTRTHVETVMPADYEVSQKYRACIQQTHRTMKSTKDFTVTVATFAVLEGLFGAVALFQN